MESETHFKEPLPSPANDRNNYVVISVEPTKNGGFLLKPFDMHHEPGPGIVVPLIQEPMEGRFDKDGNLIVTNDKGATVRFPVRIVQWQENEWAISLFGHQLVLHTVEIEAPGCKGKYFKIVDASLNRYGSFEIYDDGYGYVTLNWNALVSEQ